MIANSESGSFNVTTQAARLLTDLSDEDSPKPELLAVLDDTESMKGS